MRPVACAPWGSHSSSGKGSRKPPATHRAESGTAAVCSLQRQRTATHQVSVEQRVNTASCVQACAEKEGLLFTLHGRQRTSEQHPILRGFCLWSSGSRQGERVSDVAAAKVPENSHANQYKAQPQSGVQHTQVSMHAITQLNKGDQMCRGCFLGLLVCSVCSCSWQSQMCQVGLYFAS